MSSPLLARTYSLLVYPGREFLLPDCPRSSVEASARLACLSSQPLWSCLAGTEGEPIRCHERIWAARTLGLLMNPRGHGGRALQEGPMLCLPAHPGTAPELPAQVGALAGAGGRGWDWMRGSDCFPLQERLVQVGPSLPRAGAFQPQQPLFFIFCNKRRSPRASAGCAPSSPPCPYACALEQS